MCWSRMLVTITVPVAIFVGALAVAVGWLLGKHSASAAMVWPDDLGAIRHRLDTLELKIDRLTGLIGGAGEPDTSADGDD